MNKILITGASGYLAHRLVPIALQYGEVIGTARKTDSVITSAQAVALDLSDKGAIKHVVEAVRPTAIIHAAAVNPGSGDELMNVINHEASAIPDPINIYGETKAAGERAVLTVTPVR
ncbi:sugar nucleotide-binding protein [Leucothrix arctica]|uniref:dTDP-4-dehydrorhamnose reductase n=1 Tax=Leucothrix arctica TaxID=1481894 RepID=A0A317CGZ4_9GAMM|nr:sugar nucleotide-binding protein [Leucothrix arctica]PWQ97788.1 hypothetical protein DKT75_05860 [Leucothrix arctica]